MTLLYTMGVSKQTQDEFSNFGSEIVYANCVEQLRKYDEVVNIYDYIYKHNCGIKIDKVVLNGDQTLSQHSLDERMRFLDVLEKTGLEYTTLASSIGDGSFDIIQPRYQKILDRCVKPLRLRETCEKIGVEQVLMIDQAFWRDTDHYESLMQPYKDLKPGKFTFQYQPWNVKGATKPYFDFGVDIDVSSVAKFDDQAGRDKPNPLKLTLGNWLWLIKNCRTFYTSSYHGFAFATMFNKQVVCPCLKSRRFKSTMELLGVELSPEGNIKNHDEIMQNIKKERAKAFDYIESIYQTETKKYNKHKTEYTNKKINPVQCNCRAQDKIDPKRQNNCMENRIKYLPLGSQCFTNMGLKFLLEEKILTADDIYFYSPFNGTRILNSYENSNPQLMFLIDPDKFIQMFSNVEDWIPVSDDKDKQYINFKLNLRRCHTNFNIGEIIDNIKNSYQNYAKFKYKYILDIRQDFHSTNMNNFFHTLLEHNYDVNNDFLVVYNDGSKYLIDSLDIQVDAHNIDTYEKGENRLGEQMGNLYMDTILKSRTNDSMEAKQ